MASIIYKQLTTVYTHEAAQLHQQLIPSAGARIGKPYLTRLYKTLTTNRAHVVIGAFDQTRLVGIISVSETIPVISLLPLIPSILKGLVRNQISLQEFIDHAAVESHIKRLMPGNARYIINLAVDPKAQRRGIATELIQRVKKDHNLIVDTQKKNRQALQFYKKIGFVPVEEVADSIILRYR